MILRRASKPGTAVVFAPTSDESKRAKTTLALALPVDTWNRMGCPDEIAMTFDAVPTSDESEHRGTRRNRAAGGGRLTRGS